MAVRCEWAARADALSLAYHDQEWGVPSHDDRHLFEMLVLEGAQAGLSWATILRKREAYRAAFDRFDPNAVARFDAGRISVLMQDASIVRNRAKIESAVRNADRTLEVQGEFGSLDAYVWTFVGGSPLTNGWRSLGELPADTVESRAMSADLKRRGFGFVGPTTCYAFMQAVGMVNDHTVDCFRHTQVAGTG